MSDLNLTSFNPLYPMRIRQYDELFNDQNQNVMDKINSIIDYLNQVGKLTNDVVKDWNTVYQWVMNEGLTTDVNNKLEDMLAKGELNSIIDFLVSKMGDLTTLTTTDKTTIVNSINSLKSELTTGIGLKANQTDVTNLTTRVTNNETSLAQIVSNVKSFGAKGDGSTDDTQSFINAITSLSDGDVLLIPKGSYKITSTLSITKGIKIIGSGQTGANASTTNGTVILYSGSGQVFSISSQNVMLEHLYLLNQGANTVNGIVVANDGSVNMSNIEFSHITTMNFNIGFSAQYAYFVNFRYCRAAGGNIGFNIINCATTVNFEKCWALQCVDKGYYIVGLTYSNLINCGSDGCGYAYYLDSCNGVSLYNCGMEVSTNIPIYTNNSTMGFYGCVSYKNNSSQNGFISFAKFENSFIDFQNCYENTLFFGTVQSNNVPVLLNNTIINMQNSFLRYAIQKTNGDTSRIFGQYHKDGGIVNDIAGDISILSNTNASNLGLSPTDLSTFVNGIVTQLNTKYASSITTIPYNRVGYLTSMATGNPYSGDHTAIYPIQSGTEIFYIAVTQGGRLFVGYTSNSGSTITWTKIQTVKADTTANRPTTPQAGQEYFDTTLNKPIWCKSVSPNVWIDATGTTV